VDLAIEGGDRSDYLEIWGDFEKFLDHPFDLVELERAHIPLQKVIKKEGLIIYEQKND
jgi:hypothetical protein